MEYYRQVEMRQGNSIRIGYIEEALAKVGKKVYDEDNEKSIWVVTAVYSRLAKEALDDLHDAHKQFKSVLK